MKKNSNNVWREASMVGGGLVSTLWIAYSVYHAFKITGDLASVPFDLLMTLLLAVIFLLPAFALYKRRETGIVLTKIGILYPILVGLGFFNILFSDDPLSAGLPMLLVVAPFCIIYGLVVLFKNK